MEQEKEKENRIIHWWQKDFPDKEEYPVANQVKTLEYKYEQTKILLDEIITTFRLPQNEKWFDKNMPHNWHDLTNGWIERWKRL
ncbi:hypothetical protein LCGC14_3064830 [marine sediment metagenome]|uniref:Uncharacterized protein n=1 Tax=marine sediment metagenome TaxID=412755 RepID=A0A0F8X662_9ZZZZ